MNDKTAPLDLERYWRFIEVYSTLGREDVVIILNEVERLRGELVICDEVDIELQDSLERFEKSNDRLEKENANLLEYVNYIENIEDVYQDHMTMLNWDIHRRAGTLPSQRDEK